jgi:hypothetical protein
MTTRRAVSFLPGPQEGAGRAEVSSRAQVSTDSIPAGGTPADGFVVGGISAGDVAAGDVAAVHEWLLAAGKPGGVRGRVEMLRALEDLAGGISAVQAQLMVELDETARLEAHQVVATAEADPAGRSVPVTVRAAEREGSGDDVEGAVVALRFGLRTKQDTLVRNRTGDVDGKSRAPPSLWGFSSLPIGITAHPHPFSHDNSPAFLSARSAAHLLLTHGRRRHSDTFMSRWS